MWGNDNSLKQLLKSMNELIYLFYVIFLEIVMSWHFKKCNTSFNKTSKNGSKFFHCRNILFLLLKTRKLNAWLNGWELNSCKCKYLCQSQICQQNLTLLQNSAFLAEPCHLNLGQSQCTYKPLL